MAIVWTMKNIDLMKLNQDIEQFVKERDWEQFHSVKNLTMALNVESAELMEIFQWLSEEKSNNVKSDPKILAKVEDSSGCLCLSDADFKQDRN